MRSLCNYIVFHGCVHQPALANLTTLSIQRYRCYKRCPFSKQLQKPFFCLLLLLYIQELRARHLPAEGNKKMLGIALGEALGAGGGGAHLCDSLNCDCARNGIQCQADLCGCCRAPKHGERDGCAGHSCSNAEGLYAYKEARVSHYRAPYVTAAAVEWDPALCDLGGTPLSPEAAAAAVAAAAAAAGSTGGGSGGKGTRSRSNSTVTLNQKAHGTAGDSSSATTNAVVVGGEAQGCPAVKF
jgi:hypothetical protein